MSKEKIILTEDMWKQVQTNMLEKFRESSLQFFNDLKEYFHLQNYSMLQYYKLADKELIKEKQLNPEIENRITVTEFIEKYPILSKKAFSKIIKNVCLPTCYWGYEYLKINSEYPVKHLVFDEERICEELFSNPVYKNKSYIKTLKLLRSK